MDIKVYKTVGSFFRGNEVRVEISGINESDLVVHTGEPCSRFQTIVYRVIDIIREG